MSLTQDEFTKAELQRAVASVPHWFHSIDLGYDVITPGDRTPEQLRRELEKLCLPDLRDKSVLDIGAWDGFFSWTAERLGARRVVSLDHFVWALDRKRANEHAIEWRTKGMAPRCYEETDAWKPAELPGKRGYGLAHKILKSRVECFVGNFMEVDYKELSGPFDVVLWLGVLYHMRHPLLALEKVVEATKKVAIIETEAMELSAYSGPPLCEFFERDELAGDFTNWWVPNENALVGICRAAGFRRVEVIKGAAEKSSKRSVWKKLRSSGGHLLREFGLKPPLSQITRYRAIVHAWK